MDNVQALDEKFLLDLVDPAEKEMTHRKISLLLLSILLPGLLLSSAIAQPRPSPIKHLVVIFQENISFDHYFATYPNAANPLGEPFFQALPNTPGVNGLDQSLLTANPNLANPFRLDRSQAVTCDMKHDYTPEQKAYDNGLLDKFVQYAGATGNGCDPTQVMGYYDGNTVTALWEYAQNFALSDNSFSTTFGPSTPGALNLISGQTHGATPNSLPGPVVDGTVIGDPDPAFDDCSSGSKISMTGMNIGDLLNANGVSWGWFQGGFRPTSTTSTGKAVCGSTHMNIAGAVVKDYSAHHEPFQYYESTSNPDHLPPSSVAMIGLTDQANHQYDLADFWAAANSGNLPAVSLLKASKYQDGHPGYSDPLDEQHFLVATVSALERLPTWHSTAVIIAYDDSDGWYDHVMPPIVHTSSDPANDAVLGANLCGQTQPGQFQDRCGYGPRQPLLVISMWAKPNFVDHTITDQASILAFIEDNWHTGRIGNQSFDAGTGSLLNMFSFTQGPRANRLFLDASTGLPIHPTEDDSPTITSGD